MKRDYLKYIIVISAIIVALLAGLFWGQKIKLFKTEEKESAQVVMDRIAKVFKMVAVEGFVSEVYDYKQYKYWDVNFLRKKAIVRIKAKVSVGYDFENVEFVVNEVDHVINVNSIPEPEILSIDHDLDYYDIDEGLFNQFSVDELTQLNKRAKEYAIEMIKNGELFDEARAQKETIFGMLSEIFGQTGWKLVIDNETMGIKD